MCAVACILPCSDAGSRRWFGTPSSMWTELGAPDAIELCRRDRCTSTGVPTEDAAAAVFRLSREIICGSSKPMLFAEIARPVLAIVGPHWSRAGGWLSAPVKRALPGVLPGGDEGCKAGVGRLASRWTAFCLTEGIELCLWDSWTSTGESAEDVAAPVFRLVGEITGAASKPVLFAGIAWPVPATVRPHWSRAGGWLPALAKLAPAGFPVVGSGRAWSAKTMLTVPEAFEVRSAITAG